MQCTASSKSKEIVFSINTCTSLNLQRIRKRVRGDDPEDVTVGIALDTQDDLRAESAVDADVPGALAANDVDTAAVRAQNHIAVHTLGDGEYLPVFDDLDGGVDDAKGYRSLSHGVKPEVHAYTNLAAETTGLIQMVNEWTEKGMEPGEICIVARTKNILKDYAAALAQAGIRTYEVKRDKPDDRLMNGVRLATMHRVKGLEFSTVFIVAMNKGYMPLKSALKCSDPEAKEEALRAERCLLYVALTRAKKEVHISTYGKPSEFWG